MYDKVADLAGPGIGSYEELAHILPKDYSTPLTNKETQLAIYAAKDFIEENMCKELNLIRVQVPLIVDSQSGVNDYLDRDGSRTPIQFHINNDHNKNPIDAEVVQAATKWKRMALAQFGMAPGEGLLTDMRAVRKDYFLDHDHSAYVDQWDWERAITAEDRKEGAANSVQRRHRLVPLADEGEDRGPVVFVGHIEVGSPRLAAGAGEERRLDLVVGRSTAGRGMDRVHVGEARRHVGVPVAHRPHRVLAAVPILLEHAD